MFWDGMVFTDEEEDKVNLPLSPLNDAIVHAGQNETRSTLLVGQDSPVNLFFVSKLAFFLLV
jgi:hypothetical protein